MIGDSIRDHSFRYSKIFIEFLTIFFSAYLKNTHQNVFLYQESGNVGLLKEIRSFVNSDLSKALRNCSVIR